MKFEDNIAIVTGSSQGIGRGIALGLAEAGADVAVNYHRNRKGAEAVASEIRALGRRAIVVQADVSKRKVPLNYLQPQGAYVTMKSIS